MEVFKPFLDAKKNAVILSQAINRNIYIYGRTRSNNKTKQQT